MRLIRSTRLVAAVAFFVLSQLLVACAPAAPQTAGGAKPGAPAAASKHVRVAINNPVLEPGIAFLWIGKELGYFDEENLTVDFVPSQGAAEATQWVASGKADLAVPQASALVNAAAQGTELGLIAAYLLNRQSIYELVVRPDSPLQTPADIKGKKVGVVAEGDEGHDIYRALMKELSLPPEANEVINTGQALQAAEALKNGTVDVQLWVDTQRALTQAQGYQWRQLPAPKFYDKLFANVALTRKELLASQPEVLTSYLRSLAKASLFFTTNPDASLRLHFKMNPQTLPQDMSLDTTIERNLVGVNVRAPKLVPRTGEMWGEFSQASWEYYVRDYLALGEKIKDVTQFYTDSLIKDVNNFDQQKVINQAKNYKVQ